MQRPENPRKEPKQARSRQLVDAILEAAARVFEAQGYDATNTNRVAEVAGVSVGSMYQYFPNKDALVTALHERHVGEVLALVEDVAAEAPSRTLRASAELLVDGALAVHTTRPRLTRMLHGELPMLERTHEASAASRATFAATERLLHAHRAEVRRSDTALASYAVIRLFESLVHAAVLDPPPNVAPAPLRTTIVDAVVGYLVVPAP